MKIGKFDYINNYLPYYYIEKKKLAEIVTATPKEMIKLLESRKIDYAPIPSFYYLKHKDRFKRYRFCVASNGRVYSVIVVSKDGKIGKKVGITSETTTSVNLLKIILAEKGIKCKLVPTNSFKANDILKSCDSALVIGDSALEARKRFKVVMDLGEEWKDLTGYPMVFGISASIDNAEICDELLIKSLRWGLKNFDEVVKSAVERFGIDEEFLRTYFKALKHEMDEKCEKGLKAFEEFCRDYKLL
ncbi:menaquinone biosynthesis protein [Archaeoglobus sp.]